MQTFSPVNLHNLQKRYFYYRYFPTKKASKLKRADKFSARLMTAPQIAKYTVGGGVLDAPFLYKRNAVNSFYKIDLS